MVGKENLDCAKCPNIPSMNLYRKDEIEEYAGGEDGLRILQSLLKILKDDKSRAIICNSSILVMVDGICHIISQPRCRIAWMDNRSTSRII